MCWCSQCNPPGSHLGGYIFHGSVDNFCDLCSSFVLNIQWNRPGERNKTYSVKVGYLPLGTNCVWKTDTNVDYSFNFGEKKQDTNLSNFICLGFFHKKSPTSSLFLFLLTKWLGLGFGTAIFTLKNPGLRALQPLRQLRTLRVSHQEGGGGFFRTKNP